MSATADANCPAVSAALHISASNSLFDTECLRAPAGKPITIAFDNKDGYQHNIAILKGKDGPRLFAGEFYAGPGTVTYQLPALGAGMYLFHCEIHPFIMQGQLVVSP